MDKAEFEKRFLALVNQTDVVITAANVAYQLSLPIEEAQEQLLSLELNGVLQQQVDDQGNSTYTLPNRPTPGTLPARIEDGIPQTTSVDGPPPGVRNPAEAPPAPVYGGPVSAPAKGRNVNALALNVIIPGVGSLVCGDMRGVKMLLLLLVGLIMLFALPGWSKLVGLLPILASWIWSIIAGVALLDEREPR